MVLELLLLLVGRLVFLVDNNDPEVLEGSKDGRTGSDGDARLSPQDLSPLVITFPLSQPAVEQAEVFSESILEAGKELGSQRYLRNEHDGFSSLGQNLF